MCKSQRLFSRKYSPLVVIGIVNLYAISCGLTPFPPLNEDKYFYSLESAWGWHSVSVHSGAKKYCVYSFFPRDLRNHCSVYPNIDGSSYQCDFDQKIYNSFDVVKLSIYKCSPDILCESKKIVIDIKIETAERIPEIPDKVEDAKNPGVYLQDLGEGNQCE